MATDYSKYVIPEMTLEDMFPSSMGTGETIVNPRIVSGVAEGMSFRSADSGARVEIFPEWDPTIGQIVYNVAGTEVFKIMVDGTNEGDITLGNYSGSQGVQYDSSGDTLNIAGTLTVGGVGGWTIVTDYIYSLASGTPTSSPSDGLVLDGGATPTITTYENTEKRVELGYLASGIYGLKIYADDGTTVIFEASDTQKMIGGGMKGTGSEISIQGWQHDMAFTATDYRVIAWASGTITLMNGTTYSIDAGNTGNMTALTYIYLDIGASTTILQTSTTASNAVGSGKILVAVAQNNSDTTADARVLLFGGQANDSLILVDNLVANSAATNEFISNTAQIKDAIITNAKIADLAVGKLTAGSILSQEIVLGITATEGDSFIAGGTYNSAAWTATGGFIFGFDDSDSDKLKVFFGDATTSWDWNVTTANTMTIIGNIIVKNPSTVRSDINVADGADVTASNTAADTSAVNGLASTTLISGGKIGTNLVEAAAINVTNLAAINADLGSITAGNITLDSSGYIKGGQTAYNTGTGFWLGYDTSAYKFSIGNPSAEHMLWDGTNLYVNNTRLLNETTYGDGSDGNLTTSGDVTLTADTYYDTLTVSNGDTVYTAGYRLFCKTKLVIVSGGKIDRSGNAGANATGASGAAGGAALADGTIRGSDAGGAGGNDGSDGTAGTAASYSIGVNGAKGGDGSVGPRVGGAAGVATASPTKPRTYPFCVQLTHIADNVVPQLMDSSASSGGGAGGQGGTAGGGGGGSSGGIILIAAREIENAGAIEAHGGNGGNGFDSFGVGNGPGGGGGGSGGVIILIYNKYSGAGTKTVTAGTGGTGGTQADKGDDGDNGNAGVLIELNF